MLNQPSKFGRQRHWTAIILMSMVGVVIALLFQESIVDFFSSTFVGQESNRIQPLTCQALIPSITTVDPGGKIELTTAFQPPCLDRDGDGYGDNCELGPDCDDYRADINPGAAEICDGEDNNCSGEIDPDCGPNDIFYVDTDSIGGKCDDGNSGSESEPLCTIQAGVQKMGPGKAVYLREGIYTINDHIKIGHEQSGTTNAPAYLSSAPGEKATITSAAILADGWQQEKEPVSGRTVWTHEKDNDYQWDMLFYDNQPVNPRQSLDSSCSASCEPNGLDQPNTFCTTTEKLYARFPGEQDPQSGQVEVSQRDMSWAQIWIAGRHVFVENLKFDKAPYPIALVDGYDQFNDFSNAKGDNRYNVIRNNDMQYGLRFIANWWSSHGNRFLDNTMSYTVGPRCRDFVKMYGAGHVFGGNTMEYPASLASMGLEMWWLEFGPDTNTYTGDIVIEDNQFDNCDTSWLTGQNLLVRGNHFGRVTHVGEQHQFFNNSFNDLCLDSRSPGEQGLSMFNDNGLVSRYNPGYLANPDIKTHHNLYTNPEFNSSITYLRCEKDSMKPASDFNSFAKTLLSPPDYTMYFCQDGRGLRDLQWVQNDRHAELNSTFGAIDDTTCQDKDEDGDPQPSATCTHAFDCQDNDPGINSWAAEICSDDLDNDCDGQMDEADCVQIASPLSADYSFSATHGKFKANDEDPWKTSYLASDTPGEDEIAVTVTDARGDVSVCKTTVLVNEVTTPVNCHKLSADRATIRPNELVNLSTQIDGAPVTDASYEWEIIQGGGQIIKDTTQPWRAKFIANPAPAYVEVQVRINGVSPCRTEILVEEPEEEVVCQELMTESVQIAAGEEIALEARIEGTPLSDIAYEWWVADGVGKLTINPAEPWRSTFVATDVAEKVAIKLRVNNGSVCQANLEVGTAIGEGAKLNYRQTDDERPTSNLISTVSQQNVPRWFKIIPSYLPKQEQTRRIVVRN